MHSPSSVWLIRTCMTSSRVSSSFLLLTGAMFHCCVGESFEPHPGRAKMQGGVASRKQLSSTHIHTPQRKTVMVIAKAECLMHKCRMRQCINSECTNAQMRKCSNAQMAMPNAEMSKCTNCNAKCTNAQMAMQNA